MYNGLVMQILLKMFGLITNQQRRLWWTVVLNTALGIGAILPPYLLKLIIDDLNQAVRDGSQSAAAVRTVVVALAAMALLRVGLAAASYIQERMSDMLRLESIIELRAKLFEHLLGLSVEYYESHRAGEIVERVTEGVYQFGVWLQDVSRWFCCGY